ncbi:MAG: InlB B-repeat-containing protein [Clostridia bacterium]|nr:InlB B-repeat-containing protein [Clostridia bacterium]
MTKRAKVYQILTFVFGISLIILLLFMGITAVQKSMKLNIGFEVKPTFLCEIELNGEQIFSNHDENATIANGADLAGNTLTLNQTFYADLGAELTFTLYNYSEFKTKVSVKNTDKFAILPAYANGTASSGTITLDTPSGNVELVFEEYVMYTLTFNANTGSGSMSSMETGSGEILVLPTNTFTKDGYAFVGWNTKADGSGTTYTNLANISLTADTTLYAVWEVIYYDVTINFTYDDDSNETPSSPHAI